MSLVRRSLGLRPTTVVDTKLALDVTAYNNLLELIEGNPPAVDGVQSDLRKDKILLDRDLAQVTGTLILDKVQVLAPASHGGGGGTGGTSGTFASGTVPAGGGILFIWVGAVGCKASASTSGKVGGVTKVSASAGSCGNNGAAANHVLVTVSGGEAVSLTYGIGGCPSPGWGGSVGGMYLFRLGTG